ncbi:DNA primase family protein [Metaplanococcus flavidus]|uniref:Phage/plasmid primase, P4 family n=1 Tax=Metaplanococcus flavidus TaxID=569883 RepID=A0ABW3LB04_9BACL
MALKKVKRDRFLNASEQTNTFKLKATEQQSYPQNYNNESDGEGQAFLSAFPISDVRLLESSGYLQDIITEIKVPQNCARLVTAINMVAIGEEQAFFSALVRRCHEMSPNRINDLYKSAEVTDPSEIPEALLLELTHLLNIGKAEERGFLFDESKKRFNFNANVFAKHFLKRCHIRSTVDGRLFIYTKKGVYEEPSEIMLGKIVRQVLHEGKANSWKSAIETEIVRTLKREAPVVAEMNTKHDVLNLRDGMLNLFTYQLHSHSPDYLSTVQIPIYYNREATAPRFLQFMREITLNDNELIAVHQELIGYWLTGETKAEKAVFYYGSGANGKSVLASIINELVGAPNVSSVPLSQFSDQFGMESMIGKSLNISAENEMGAKALKTENFKAIVSGDTITINIKYRPAISYRPYCRLVFLVNSLPDSSDVTEGYFRKLMIVPFSKTFKKDERNVNLKNELLQELPGILNWAILGLKRLREKNYQFSPCAVIEEAERSYIGEQNPVYEFYQAHVITEKGVRTKQPDFHNLYLWWLENQGIDDKGTKVPNIFWKYLKIILENENIPINRKKVNGTNCLYGIRLVGLEDMKRSLLNSEFH